MILQPSYLHNGISYTGKMASLYWFSTHMVTFGVPQTISVYIMLQETWQLISQQVLLRLGLTYWMKFYFRWDDSCPSCVNLKVSCHTDNLIMVEWLRQNFRNIHHEHLVRSWCLVTKSYLLDTCDNLNSSSPPPPPPPPPPPDIMPISETLFSIFRCIFMNEKFWILIKSSLKFVLKGPIDNNSALV